MGFILNVDLETSSGPTHEAYIRVDNYRFNKVTSELIVTTTAWLNAKKAHNFNRKYIDEPLKNAVGLIGSEVIYYNGEDNTGIEVSIPNLFKGKVTEVKSVEIPIYEQRPVEKEVPYISFDQDGEEITLTRKVTENEKVQVDTKTEIKEIINPEVLTNLFDYSYGVVKKELMKIFPESLIEKY